MRAVLGLSRLLGKAGPADRAASDAAMPPLESGDAAASSASCTPPGALPIASPVASPPAHLARTTRLKGNLESAMDQVQHARFEAEQIAEMLADYEAKARLADTLGAKSAALAQELEDERFKAADLAAKTGELGRELARSHEDAARAQEAADQAKTQVDDLTLARQRDADRMLSLTVQISGLQAELGNVCEIRERAEVEGAGLRAALAEREQALALLHNKESEWRLRAEKDASQLADLEQAGERKERRIAELSGALEKSTRRIEELEERGERATEHQRQLEIRFDDFRVSSEGRIFTLSGALSQEQAGHRVTRKLLEEMRQQSQAITDENRQLKDQAVNLAQENQQMKRELGGSRGTIRDYGERLSELNLRYSAAQDDIARLETAMAEGKKEARRLKRRSARLDDLHSENSGLHEKIKSLHHSLDHYRSAGGPGRDAPHDAPVSLASRRLQDKSGDTSGNTGATPISEAAPLRKMS
jgi:chromosome segregation ATPase